METSRVPVKLTPAARDPRPSLPRWTSGRFEVAADPQLLRQLIADMEAHGGDQMPADCWKLDEHTTWGPMSGLLDDWCGAIGKLSFAEQAAALGPQGERFREALAFARAIDHQGLLDGVDLTALADAQWRVLDWSSLVDLLLITAFCELPQHGARILEIGGGFGRIPEFFQMCGYHGLKYTNVDAVPASLMYCHEYLRLRFPQRKVAMFLDADMDTSAVDFLIVPAWRAGQALKGGFDLGINIESFQEMSQALVDHYIGLLDRQVSERRFIYMTNSRDYRFTGEYRFPPHWECLFRHRTLRAWTQDHPTEIYRKREIDVSAAHRVRDYFYRQELAALPLAGRKKSRASDDG